MELAEAMRTAGAVRAYSSQPVTDDELRAVLDLARFAPSGGNRQGWGVIVVRDPQLREAIRDLSVVTWRQYMAQVEVGEQPFDASGTRPSVDLERAGATPREPAFVDEMDEAPVMLVIVADTTRIAATDRYLDRIGIVGGASIYPFCQNLLLAARSMGIGGVLTTFLARAEPEARRLLALPETHAVAAVITLGHTDSFPTRLSRRPVEAFTTVDRFDGPVFGAT